MLAASVPLVRQPTSSTIVNLVKRSDVRGPWLESHFRWQIRTFWYGLLWVSMLRL